jgi:SAM-dependent methyltransferase
VKQPLGERVRDSLKLRALDVKDRVSGRADRLVPPRRLDFAGHSDFVETGDEFLDLFTSAGQLRPDEAVLEVGCGIGRMARPLAKFLTGGSYAGFDVNRDAIGWCRRRYARFDNFEFHVADLYNRRYNPHGANAAADYRFPYDDQRFDFVVLTSVLTHLLEAEAEHYLEESLRVLRPGGRVFATFFLLNDESRRLIGEGASALAFLDPDDHVSVLDADLPEEAVAYDEGWVRERLDVKEVRYGSWCGREEFASFQDVVVAQH